MIKRIKQWIERRNFNAGYDYAAGCLLRGEKIVCDKDSGKPFDEGAHAAVVAAVVNRWRNSPTGRKMAAVLEHTEFPGPNAKKLWRGCSVCYGSGGKRDNPCKACKGTGKIFKDKK
jgi:hypothetical protein